MPRTCARGMASSTAVLVVIPGSLLSLTQSERAAQLRFERDRAEIDRRRGEKRARAAPVGQTGRLRTKAGSGVPSWLAVVPPLRPLGGACEKSRGFDWPGLRRRS